MGEIAMLDPCREQRSRALENANRVRQARAETKREIAAGELDVTDVLLSCPWQVQSMEISDLLMSQKRWGRARCRRLLQAIRVPENKPIGTLTERQRLALTAMLSAGGPVLEAAPEPAPGRFLSLA